MYYPYFEHFALMMRITISVSFPWFQASAVMVMRSVLFWGIRPRRGNPSWQLKMGPIGCPKMSVTDYHSTLCSILEVCRFMSAWLSCNLAKTSDVICEYVKLYNWRRYYTPCREPKCSSPCLQKVATGPYLFKNHLILLYIYAYIF
jgi:hypothetical protein